MAKAKQKEEGFIVHFSTYDTAVEDLTLEQIGELFVKMGRFHFYGEDVSSDDKGVRMVLKMVRPYMKKASERYKEAVENGYKGKEHGIKGGRPRKGETREEYDARRLERVRNLEGGSENPQKPLNKDIDTDKDIEIKKNTDIEITSDIENQIDIKKEIEIKRNSDIERKTDVEVISNVSSYNSEWHPSKLSSENTAFQGEGYFNNENEVDSKDDDLYEGTGNYLGTYDEVMGRLSLQESSNAEHKNDVFKGTSEMEMAVLNQIAREIETLIDCDEGRVPKSVYPKAFQRAVNGMMSLDVMCTEEMAKQAVRDLKKGARPIPSV